MTTYSHKSSSIRNQVFIVGGVLLLHTAALWGIQKAMVSTPPKDIIEPAVIMTQLIAAPAPTPAATPVPAPPTPEPPPPVPSPPPPPPPPPEPPPPAPKPPPPKPQPKPVAKPKPPSERAPIVEAPKPPPPAPPAAPTPAPPAPTPPAPTPPAPAPVAAANTTANQQQAGAPQSSEGEPVIVRDERRNAATANHGIVYPSQSQRLREEGLVRVRVLIGTDGRAKNAEIAQSSGSSRLDRAAIEGILRNGRFSPTTRNGVPIEDWYVLPVNFKLPR